MDRVLAPLAAWALGGAVFGGAAQGPGLGYYFLVAFLLGVAFAAWGLCCCGLGCALHHFCSEGGPPRVVAVAAHQSGRAVAPVTGGARRRMWAYRAQ